MWDYICVKADEWTQILMISYSACPPYYQMYGMFYRALVFNQPLSFKTAKVENVRVNLCWVKLDEKPDSDFNPITISDE